MPIVEFCKSCRSLKYQLVGRCSNCGSTRTKVEFAKPEQIIHHRDGKFSLREDEKVARSDRQTHSQTEKA